MDNYCVDGNYNFLFFFKMKKLFGIVVLGLLTCNISFADNLRVVDGDTIVLNGEKIRFSGIDTPELKQTCMQGNEEVGCCMPLRCCWGILRVHE